MDLIPSTFYSLSDILMTYKIKVENGVAVKKSIRFRNLETMVKAALKIIDSFRSLHRQGMSYQDLNDGGIFIDLETGNVLICDCDNVAPYGENFGISGKPGYMAPEVVTHLSKPSANTDRYSLAVVLFKLFFRGDPLEGSKVISCSALTGSNELKHYGTDPVFVFNPFDDSNRPVKGVHDNVIKMWPLYPNFVRSMFIKTFTEGLKNASNRTSDNDWYYLMLKLHSSLFKCSCGVSERFSDPDLQPYICPHCKSSYPTYIIKNNRHQYPITIGPNTILKKYQTTKSSENYDTVTGQIVQSKNNPSLFGLKNDSNYPWNAVMPDGLEKTIPSGKIAMFINGMSFKFDESVIMKRSD